VPQLNYSQNAIIAQPGMVMDGPEFAFDKVSRICSAVIPFGTLCEMDANGNAQPVQDATTLSGTVTVTNGNASITFSTAQTLAAGTALIFSDQPSVVYYLASNVAAATAGTLTVLYSGTGGAGKLTSLVFSPNLVGISIFDPLGEEENYVPWSVPVTLAGTVTVTIGSPTLTFTSNQTLAAGTTIVFSQQPGVPYFIKTATTASTSATLTANYAGTVGGGGGTAVTSGLGSTCPGYKIGRSVPFLRKGRIWVLGDAGGTVLQYGAINVNHSSTTGAQGVFTFTGVTQTAGSEVSVAPGCVIYQPNTGANQATSVTDSFGNTFFIYPVEISI
jgi:hypothetical protein